MTCCLPPHPTDWGIDNNLRTAPRSHNRYSQHSQISETSVDGPSHYDPYSSFIPVVLDPSPAPPATLPSTTYRPNRSSSYDLYYQSDRSRETPSNARPSYDRKISESPSHYESDKGRRPHIASQERSRLGGTDPETGRRSHDSERDRERKEKLYFTKETSSTYSSSYTSREQSRQGDADDASIRSRSTVLAKGPPGGAQDREIFKLGEVPLERKKSPQMSSAEEEQDPQDIPISFSALDLDVAPSTFASDPPPRGDSFKIVPLRGDSPSSIHRKPVGSESPIHSASPSGSQRSRGTSGSNASAITAAESPEVGLGAKESTDHRPQGIRINTTTTVSNISYSDPSSFAYQSSASQGSSSKPVPQHRPSTAQGSNQGSSASRSGSVSSAGNSNGSVLPPFKSPVSDLSMEEDIARVFGGGESSASILRKSSSAARHGRSFSDMATRSTSQSLKWPRSPGGGNQVYGYSGDVVSPASSLDSKDENNVLRQELRRSTQKIKELEARLNVCTPPSQRAVHDVLTLAPEYCLCEGLGLEYCRKTKYCGFVGDRTGGVFA